jgi:hypothetical protein
LFVADRDTGMIHSFDISGTARANHCPSQKSRRA